MKVYFSVACIGMSACTVPIDDEMTQVIVMPTRSTSKLEITAALQEMVKTYPVCATFRPLHLVGREIDFDPKGKAALVYSDGEATLDSFVDLGYLSKTALPALGQKGFRFDLTERAMQKNAIVRDSFCLPAERALVSVTSIERVPRSSSFDEGYLLVRFTHEADPQSIWMRQPSLIRLFKENRSTKPGPIEGIAQLYRVWTRDKQPLKGAPHNGELWALRYDRVHNRYEHGPTLGLGL